MAIVNAMGEVHQTQTQYEVHDMRKQIVKRVAIPRRKGQIAAGTVYGE